MGIASLVWRGDELVDWASGGTVLTLEGRVHPSPLNFGYPFDAAIQAPSLDCALIYSRLGTKGILVDDRGEVLREIDRSYYCATSFEYPVAIGRTRTGREFLAHCPQEYCRLEIEDLKTGDFLTEEVERDSPDCFFSRLQVSPNGTLLLSAGWVWHPYNVVSLHDVKAALKDPGELDRFDHSPRTQAEVVSAAFLDDRRVVVVTAKDPTRDEEEPWDPTTLDHGLIGIWDARKREYSLAVRPQGDVGTILPLDERYVVGFHGHPKIFDLQTGEIVHAWPDISTGSQESSILRGENPPPLALDPVHRRFAVVEERGVRVVELGD